MKTLFLLFLLAGIGKAQMVCNLGACVIPPIGTVAESPNSGKAASRPESKRPIPFLSCRTEMPEVEPRAEGEPCGRQAQFAVGITKQGGWIQCPVKDEPVDVPAIQETLRGCAAYTQGILHCSGRHIEGQECECPFYSYTQTKYSCVDKSRILLKSEDGKEHCIKLK